jgi:hypothetical protein
MSERIRHLIHMPSLKVTPLLIIIWFFSSPATVLAQSPSAIKPNPLAEKWVLEQVAAGQVADLQERFPDEADRVLSADFLEKLLTGSLKDVEVPRQGIRIRHAMFVEPIDLRNAEIPYEIWLKDCRFEEKLNLSNSFSRRNLFLDGTVFDGPVDFSYAEIAANLYADQTQFTNTEQTADFNTATVRGTMFFREAVFEGPVDFIVADIGVSLVADEVRFTNPEQTAEFDAMKVGHNAYFSGAVFTSTVDFNGADIGNQFVARRAKFTNPDQGADFYGMRVGQIAFFDEAIFEGPVDFALGEIGVNLEADGAQFNAKQKASFNGMKVGNSVKFNKVVFAGAVDFTAANIGSQFQADEAQFSNAEKEATFDGMKVEGIAFFRKAIFAGPVVFRGADFGNQFLAEEAQFTNAEQTASFKGMKVGDSIFLNNAVFAGPVDFERADIAVNLDADSAQFNAEQTASFKGMKVGDTVFLNNAVFAGAVDFITADIGSQFQADEAQFTNAEQTVSFDGMKVEDIAFFRKVILAGPVSFADAFFLDLMIQGTVDSPYVVPRLDLSRTLVKRELSIQHLELQDLIATSLSVGGPASLSQLNIENTANLEHSSFARLTLQEISWPQTSESFRLDGMTFQHIGTSPESEKDTWQKLLELANQSAYSDHLYAGLEDFFQQQGQPERADQVFIAQKRRLRAELLARYSLDWWWNLFLEIFVFYGRSPARAFVWSVPIVFTGWLIFRRREGMEIQGKDKNPSRRYSAFWYSLDLFVPIDLQTASIWAPRPERRFAQSYMRVHKILGWVLIPIAFLAVTGIIK